jgi:hypothetical protein
LRMLLFSRLRASASTWSFHRSDFHSGPRGAVATPDCAGPPRACTDSAEREFGMAFTPLGIALDLDMDMAHLRGVGDLSGERDCYFRLGPDWVCVHNPATGQWTRIWTLPPIRAATHSVGSLIQSPAPRSVADRLRSTRHGGRRATVTTSSVPMGSARSSPAASRPETDPRAGGGGTDARTPVRVRRHRRRSRNRGDLLDATARIGEASPTEPARDSIRD